MGTAIIEKSKLSEIKIGKTYLAEEPKTGNLLEVQCVRKGSNVGVEFYKSVVNEWSWKGSHKWFLIDTILMPGEPMVESGDYQLRIIEEVGPYWDGETSMIRAEVSSKEGVPYVMDEYWSIDRLSEIKVYEDADSLSLCINCRTDGEIRAVIEFLQKYDGILTDERYKKYPRDK